MLMQRDRKRVFRLRDGRTVTYERKNGVQSKIVADPDGRATYKVYLCLGPVRFEMVSKSEPGKDFDGSYAQAYVEAVKQQSDKFSKKLRGGT